MAQRNPSAVSVPWAGLAAVGATALAVGAAAPGLLHVENPTWLMTRAAGLVAFALLWLSVMLGLLQSTGYFRMAGVVDLHTFVSVWSLYATVSHVVVLLFDQHSPYRLMEILVPFGSRISPVLNGLGGIAFYIALGVSVTTYFRNRIGVKAWRAIHLTSLVAFLFALVHAVVLGTDSDLPAIAFFYRFAAVSAAGLLGYRIYLGVKKRANSAGGR
jgi:methionine sulfoxide reductase heme-binding subunit